MTGRAGAGEPATLDEMDFVFNGGVAFRFHLIEPLLAVVIPDAGTAVKFRLANVENVETSLHSCGILSLIESPCLKVWDFINMRLSI